MKMSIFLNNYEYHKSNYKQYRLYLSEITDTDTADVIISTSLICTCTQTCIVHKIQLYMYMYMYMHVHYNLHVHIIMYMSVVNYQVERDTQLNLPDLSTCSRHCL